MAKRTDICEKLGRMAKTLKRTKRYPLVLIEWEDSVLGYQGWKFINEQPKSLTRFLSVGFLVYSDKNCKILYAHLEDGEENVTGSGDIKIPCSAIKKIETLRK